MLFFKIALVFCIALWAIGIVGSLWMKLRRHRNDYRDGSA